MVQPETRIYRKIMEYLKQQGAFVFKVWGSDHMMAGLPDLIVCYRGRFIGMEVKVPGGQPSKRQTYVHGLIRDAGGTAAVVTSVGDAERLLALALGITPAEDH